MAFVAGILVVIVWAAWMGARIDNQHARNDYLKGQIKQVDARIAKIKNLEKVRDQLLARKRIIEKLQSNRSQMVHLFDSLVTTIPDSVRLTSLKQQGQHLELAGVAQSNASVAKYMRQLDASPWMGKSDLEKTVNHHDGSRTPYTFGLGLTLSKPSEAEQRAAEQAPDDETADTTPASGGSAPPEARVSVTTPDDAAPAAAASGRQTAAAAPARAASARKGGRS
jgi:type IV pilus assembly protein PilN